MHLTALVSTPATTRREVALWIADEKQGRHWLVTCWCDARHDGTEAGMTFVAPPWDEARDAEVAA